MNFAAAFVTWNETSQSKEYNWVGVEKCTEDDFKPFVEAGEEHNPERIGMGRE